MAWEGTDPSKWAENAEARLTALLRNSVQALAKEASSTIPNGGRVPVKTGNLGRSVIVDNKPPERDAEGVEHKVQRDITGGIGAIVPGQPVYIGWTPRYAARVNFGFVGQDSLGRTFNQSGAGFAEATAAKWPEIVQAEAAKIAGRR